MEGDAIQLQDLFEFAQTGIGGDGRVQGTFRTTGLRSRFFERMVAAGVKPADLLCEPGQMR
jgi:pilus assembly protein CpaF